MPLTAESENMSDEISDILDSYHSTTLWEMARAAGVEVLDRQGKRIRKADLINKMRDGFFTEARVLTSLERLDQRERAILNRLLLRNGTARTKSFRREIIRARLATAARGSPRLDYHHRVPYAEGYAGHPFHQSSRLFEDYVARLTYRGLVFSRDGGLTTGGSPYKLQFHPGATLFIPEIIRQYLPQPEPVPDQDSEWRPTRVQTGEPTLLLRDLYLYWDFVRRNRVSLIQAGFVGKRSLKAINAILLVPDPSLDSVRREDETGRLYLLRRLLESLELVRREKGQLRLNPESPLHIPEFWSAPPSDQLRACLEAWVKSGDEQTPERHNIAQYGPNYERASSVFVEALRALPPTSWFEPADLLERVQELDVDFLFPDHSRIENYRGSWYYSYASGRYLGHPTDVLHTIEELEALFVNRCISGFFLQLGAVELGCDAPRGDTWQVFRLTSIGHHILGTRKADDSSGSDQDQMGRLVIQPNFHLVALGPVSLASVARIELFADREAADQGAFQFRLSRESVYRAQQQGMDVADVIRFLEQISDVDLPQNVQRSLNEWSAQHEQIVFRTGVSVLQTADADLMTELMDEPSIERHVARRTTPEIALLKTKKPSQLVAALVQRGLLPAVSESGPEPVANSVIVGDDGTMHCIHPFAGFHLRARLCRLAERVTDSDWRLTPVSVRQAGGSKIKVLRILDELRELHRGRFPEALADQIKAWGGYYGDAGAETLTLIEFRDQATLRELREHPELHALLTPFPAGDRALAVVPENRLEQASEMLTRYGVQVKEHLQG